MCGIAGIVDPGGTSQEAQLAEVQAMCDLMTHRGPDDIGIDPIGGATLGMRRLAIFDPAHGHQPMHSPDGRLALVFNGAIYNFKQLREELVAAGWSFHTECDTEVLLAAFARWGEGCLPRLRGMFAFAVWNKPEQSLFLARDSAGIKPLYYRLSGARLTFASELNALTVGCVPRPEISPEAAADYLAWLAVPAPRTIYRGIFSLCPGQSARFQDGRLQVRNWWTFGGIPGGVPPCRSRGEFQESLRARLEDSIRAHVIADVPVGAFLSGGLDSAVVVGLMTQATGQRLRTFSIDFAEREFSEAEPAAQTARHFGTEHRSLQVTGSRLAADLGRILETLDQPTGDGINTWYASQAARAGGVTVALSGLGGDELFGGYPSFRDVPRLARWLPRWRALPAAVRELVLRRLNSGDSRRRKLADLLEHAGNLHELAALQRRVFSRSGQRSLLSPAALAEIGSRPAFHPAIESLAEDLAAAEPLAAISAWELRTYMADVLLRDSDVMSMRHSLELRVPFVDRPLLEWLWRQPAGFRFDPQRPKGPLAAALGDLLPAGVSRRPKRGFSLPMDAWMRRELRPFLDEAFSESSVSRSGLFNPSAVRELWRNYQRRADPREWSRIWSLAILIAFVNRPALQAHPPRVPPRRLGSAVPFPVRFDFAAATSNRTLLLAPEIFSSEGGIPRILQTYLRALSELALPGGTVRLVSLNDAVIAPADLQRCASEVLEQHAACNRSKARFVREALRMGRDCDRIVCGHIRQLPVAWLARRLNPRLKYYLIAHGIEVWRDFSAVERAALRGATRIFCVSDYTRSEFLQRCPLPPDRAVVLPNALDPAFTIEPGRPLAECPPVILAVTRLSFEDRYKGVQDLIEAMPAIVAAIPAARLRIIGRGNDLTRLKSVRHRLGLGTAVEFRGYVDDRRLSEDLGGCRLFALPSRNEGFGLVFLEAMAHGRPCLGARAGGVPEIITAETGVLVEPGNLEALAAGCIAALQRDWNGEAILARAREFSFPEFKVRLSRLLAS